MKNEKIQALIRQLKDVTGGDLWIDENFRKKIDHISEKEAFTRPHPQVHSVAENISHLIVWRKEIMHRFNRIQSGFDAEGPANWRTNEELIEKGWKELKQEFYIGQENIISFLDAKEDSFLDELHPNGYTFQYLADGLIHHDIYHLGQIGITVKLLQVNT
jgi:uncharacterized damage-inducible protein DinB